jgi:hypothetical protein
MATSAVWWCESKIAVFLGVVSFLWFVSLDKQKKFIRTNKKQLNNG